MTSGNYNCERQINKKKSNYNKKQINRCSFWSSKQVGKKSNKRPKLKTKEKYNII